MIRSTNYLELKPCSLHITRDLLKNPASAAPSSNILLETGMNPTVHILLRPGSVLSPVSPPLTYPLVGNAIFPYHFF